MNKEEEPEYTPKNINEVLICIFNIAKEYMYYLETYAICANEGCGPAIGKAKIFKMSQTEIETFVAYLIDQLNKAYDLMNTDYVVKDYNLFVPNPNNLIITFYNGRVFTDECFSFLDGCIPSIWQMSEYRPVWFWDAFESLMDVVVNVYNRYNRF